MPWPAEDALDPEPSSSRSNRHTVIAGLDVSLNDADITRHLDMDAVCVWTITWRNNIDTDHLHSLTAMDHNVVQLAVHRAHPNDFNILRVAEGKRLEAHAKTERMIP